jgi:hypothetical protein
MYKPALLITVLATLASAAAHAQRIEPRFTAGAAVFADDGAAIHSVFGGSARVYLTRRWSVEPEFLYLRQDSRDSDFLFWGNFSYDLRDRAKRVVPYWFAAPGVIRHQTKFASSTFTNVEAGFGTGFGTRIYVKPRVFVAPQVRFGAADGFFVEATGSIGFILKP